MKEQLIEFKTAKLAKEKGFDISTGSKCWVKSLDGVLMHNSDRQYNNPLHDRTLDYYLSQPTQSLLQKWLREKHNIEVISDVNFYNKKEKLGYFYSIACFDDKDIHDGKDYDLDQLKKVGKTRGFNTYEEALEKGLQEGLKLIK